VLGEYVGAIFTQVQHRPYVIELERVNFDTAGAQPEPNHAPNLPYNAG